MDIPCGCPHHTPTSAFSTNLFGKRGNQGDYLPPRQGPFKTLLANDTINGNRAVRVQKPSGMTRKRSKNGLILTSFHSVCHSPTKSFKDRFFGGEEKARTRASAMMRT